MTSLFLSLGIVLEARHSLRLGICFRLSLGIELGSSFGLNLCLVLRLEFYLFLGFCLVLERRCGLRMRFRMDLELVVLDLAFVLGHFFVLNLHWFLSLRLCLASPVVEEPTHPLSSS